MAITSTIAWLVDGMSLTDSKDNYSLSENANITFSSAVTDAIDAQRYSGLSRGIAHRTKKYLFIESLQFIAMTGVDWQVSVSYSVKPPSDKEKTQEQQAIVTPFSWEYKEVVEYDKLTGDAFLNPAGDPLDPPFEVERGSLGFRIQKAEKSFREDFYTYIGFINSNSFTLAGVSIPAYCAMITSYDPKPAIDEKGYPYFIVDYEIRILKKKDKDGAYIGFKEETLNAGFNFKDGGVKKKILIKDQNDEDIEPNEPQLLDANGAITASATYTTRCPRSAISFTIFALPSKFPTAGSSS